MTAPTTQAEQEDAVRDRYTVVYEGDSTGVKILSGEPATGRAVTVMAGDIWEEARTLRTERDQLAADLRKAREEVDRLTDLADAAAFHFFCCNDGIHRDDECGALVPSMAELARAINFRNDPATDEEIAAIPNSEAETKRSALLSAKLAILAQEVEREGA